MPFVSIYWQESCRHPLLSCISHRGPTIGSIRIVGIGAPFVRIPFSLRSESSWSLLVFVRVAVESAPVRALLTGARRATLAVRGTRLAAAAAYPGHFSSP